jgi:hypothetical protein
MERPDTNPMPEVHVGIGDLARAAFDGLKWLVSLPEGGYPSEYPKHPERRGAAMLDTALDQSPFEPLPTVERPDAGQLTSRWDDMGRY